MEVDLSMIPEMTSKIYTEYLDSQANQTTNSTLMYELGQQLGLGQKLFATRAAKVQNNNVGLYAGIGVLIVGLIVGATLFIKRKNKLHYGDNVMNSQVTNDEAEALDAAALN